jgi:predicted HD phosphohydrolase
LGYKKIGTRLRIDQADFYREIVESKRRDALTDGAVNYFIKMASHGVKHANLNYPDPRDQEDVIQSALHDLCKYWRNFNEKDCNDPFSFFTSFIFNGYAKEFKVIHKHRFIKHQKKYKVEIDDAIDFPKLVSEISCVEKMFCDTMSYSQIKKIFVRYKCGSVLSRWFEYDKSNIDATCCFIDGVGHVDSIDVKIDYIASMSFLSLNQGGDSEIYTI